MKVLNEIPRHTGGIYFGRVGFVSKMAQYSPTNQANVGHVVRFGGRGSSGKKANARTG